MASHWEARPINHEPQTLLLTGLRMSQGQAEHGEEAVRVVAMPDKHLKSPPQERVSQCLQPKMSRQGR